MKKINFLYLQLLLVALFFGGTFIAGRVISQYLPPFTSSFLRFSIATLFLYLFLLLTKVKISLLDWKSNFNILLLALTGIIGYNYFFFSGLKLIDASRASMIVSLNPASIAIFSFIFFKERIEKMKILGILLSFAGALIVITRGQLNLFFAGSLGLGELYILGCVVCWTSFTLISKSVLQKVKPLIAVTLACTVGTFFLFMPALKEGYLTQIFHFDIKVWLSLGALAILGTVLSYIWYYEGLSRIGASRTGVFINFVPVWATALAILILNESIEWSFIIGAIIVLSGVFLVNTRKTV